MAKINLPAFLLAFWLDTRTIPSRKVKEKLNKLNIRNAEHKHLFSNGAVFSSSIKHIEYEFLGTCWAGIKCAQCRREKTRFPIQNVVLRWKCLATSVLINLKLNSDYLKPAAPGVVNNQTILTLMRQSTIKCFMCVIDDVLIDSKIFWRWVNLTLKEILSNWSFKSALLPFILGEKRKHDLIERLLAINYVFW